MQIPLNEKPQAETLPRASAANVFLNNRYLPPPADEDGRLWVRTSALIQGDAKELYALWRDTESAPLWQEQVVAVTKTGDLTSHWSMKAGDKTVEWNAEILADEPGKRLAWRSIDGDVDEAGEVVFEQAPGGRGVFVVLFQEYRMSKLANAWETLKARSPKQAAIESLRHFKALAETGEIPRTQGQPHGPRGIVGDMKKAAYGETIATPQGTNQAAN